MRRRLAHGGLRFWAEIKLISNARLGSETLSPLLILVAEMESDQERKKERERKNEKCRVLDRIQERQSLQ